MVAADMAAWGQASDFGRLFVQGAGVGALILAFGLGMAAGKAVHSLSLARAAVAPGRPWGRLFALLREPAARSWREGNARDEIGLWLGAGAGSALCAGLAALTAMAPDMPGSSPSAWGVLALRLVASINLAGLALCLAWLFHQMPCDAFESARHWALDPVFAERCKALEREALAREESVEIAGCAPPPRGRSRPAPAPRGRPRL